MDDRIAHHSSNMKKHAILQQQLDNYYKILINTTSIDTTYCWSVDSNITEDFKNIAYTVISPCLVTLGILGNMIVIGIFSRRLTNRQLHTNTLSTCMILLMVMDSLVLLFSFFLFTLPLAVNELMVIVPAVIGITHLSRTASILLETLMVFDRWLAVCYPLKHKVISTSKRMITCGCIMSLIAVVYSIPRFFEVEVDYAQYCDGNVRLEAFSTKLRFDTIYKGIYLTAISFILLFLLPLATIGVLNIWLCVALFRGTRVLNRPEQSPLNQGYAHNRARHDNSTSIMLCMDAFVFIICSSLSSVMNLIETANIDFFSKEDTLETAEILRHTNNLLYMLNSATNFFVFYSSGSQFRKCVNDNVSRMFSSVPQNEFSIIHQNDSRLHNYVCRDNSPQDRNEYIEMVQMEERCTIPRVNEL